MLKKIWSLIKDTFKEWSEDKAPRLAAALSYYTIFSIPPLLVIVIAIIGMALGSSDAAQRAILTQIQALVGDQAAEGVSAMIAGAQRPGAGLIASIVGIVTLLLGASGVFGQLQEALNTIWDVKPKPGLGIMATIRKRFFSFTMVLGVGFLLLVSLVVTAALGALGNLLTGFLPQYEAILQVVNFIVSFLIITLLFALIYKFVPDAEIAWRDLWPGAAVTALLFTLGKMAIGIYLGSSNVTTTFGAAASVIIMLLWVYYSAQILFFGAEFTQVYANQYGQKIRPDEDAVWITEADRENQGIPSRHRPAPGGQAIPVTSTVTITTNPLPALPQPKNPSLDRLLDAGMPLLVALVIGLVGGWQIVKEQKNMPRVRVVRKKPAPVEVVVQQKDKTGKVKKRKRFLAF